MSNTPEQTLLAYEAATNSHDFDQVEPLVAQEAVYYFSDGTYRGLTEIRQVFERNWDIIRDETYRITDVEWLFRDATSAACVYLFHWEGWMKGERKSGSGRGTNIFVHQNGRWQIIHEHLSLIAGS